MQNERAGCRMKKTGRKRGLREQSLGGRSFSLPVPVSRLLTYASVTQAEANEGRALWMGVCLSLDYGELRLAPDAGQGLTRRRG